MSVKERQSKAASLKEPPPVVIPFVGPGQANNGEVLDYGQTGLTLYAWAHSRSTGNWWNGNTSLMEAYQDAHWSVYAILLSELGTSGVYLFIPPGTLPPDDYDFGVRQRAGGTAALTDLPISILTDRWDGTHLSPIPPWGQVADPWSILLPGAYAAGSAGNIIGNRLDANVGSRLPTSSYVVAPTVAQIDTQLSGSHGAGAWGASDPWATALPGAYAAGSAGNIVGNRLDVNVGSRPTATQIDTQLSGSHGAGTWGAGDPWLTLLPGSYAAGTAGNIVGSRLDVNVSSRPTAAQIDTQLSGSHGSGSWGTAAVSDPWNTPLPGSYPAGTAGSIIGSRLDAAVSSRLATTGYTVPPTVAQIDTQLSGSHGAGSWVDVAVPDPWGVSLPASYGAGTAGNILGNRLDVNVGSRPTAAQIDTQLSGSHGGGSWATAVIPDPWATALPGGYVAGSAGNILGNRLDVSVSSRPTATDIDTQLSGSHGSGAWGGAAASDPWATVLPGAYAAGTAGNIIGNRIDANITSRPSAAQIDTQLSGSHGGGSWATAVVPDPWATPVPGSYPAGSAGNILGVRLDQSVGSRLAAANYVVPPTTAQIDAQLASSHGGGSWATAVIPDPWATSLPGAYPSGQAGYILGTHLDANVSSRPTAAQIDTQLSGSHGAGQWGATGADPWATVLPGAYAANTAGSILGNRLDVAVSSRPNASQIDTQLSGSHGSGSWLTGVAGDPWAVALPGAYGAGTAGSIIGSNLDAPVSSRPTAAQIDTQLSGSHGSGSWLTGPAAADPWATLIPASYAPGSAGQILGARLDANVTSRPSAAQIDAQLSSSHGNGAWTTAAASDPWATPIPGTYPPGTAGSILGSRLDANVTSRLAAANYTVPPTAAQIDARLSTVHGPGSWEDIDAGSGSGNGIVVSYPALVPGQVTMPGAITRRRGDTWLIQITGLGNLQGRTKLYFGMKYSTGEGDDTAALLVEETAGLITVAGNPATVATDASLQVQDDLNGNVDLIVAASATKLLAVDFGYPYDIQMEQPGTPPQVTTIGEGLFTVVADVVRTDT